MEQNQDWDIIHLGYYPDTIVRRKAKVNNGMIRINCYGAHAYILSRRMMEKLHQMKYAGSVLDAIYYRSPNAYQVYPPIFHQDEQESDAEKSVFPGLSTLLDYNLWYCYHINVPFIYLVPFILVLLIVLLLFRVHISYILLIFLLIFLIIFIYPDTIESCGY